MIINSITPFSLNSKNQNVQSANNRNRYIAPQLATLQKDTVSFTAKPSLIKVADFIEAKFDADSGRMNRIATTYLDVLESVAFKLKDMGFSFDRAYCEQNPVKSAKSYTSKIVRSGNFKVPDAIRATLYCRDPYDLSLLNDVLLPEMKKRGYVLAQTEMTIKDLMKRGYVPTAAEMKDLSKEKLVPDLDIRLDDVSDQVTKLAPNLRYSISHPQKSGYEDIQMRFVRDFDNKSNPVQHELIILFGPNTSKAKHEESKYVYTPLRELDELHVNLSDKTIGSHSYRAGRYIDLIKQMFRGKISEKLFLNAKNKDKYEIPDEIPISFNQDDISLFENYFSGLLDRVSSIYKETRSAANVTDSVKKQLTKDLRQDKAKIRAIHDKLKETIDYYNYLNDLKKD